MGHGRGLVPPLSFSQERWVGARKGGHMSDRRGERAVSLGALEGDLWHRLPQAERLTYGRPETRLAMCHCSFRPFSAQDFLLAGKTQ